MEIGSELFKSSLFWCRLRALILERMRKLLAKIKAVVKLCEMCDLWVRTNKTRPLGIHNAFQDNSNPNTVGTVFIF